MRREDWERLEPGDAVYRVNPGAYTTLHFERYEVIRKTPKGMWIRRSHSLSIKERALECMTSEDALVQLVQYTDALSFLQKRQRDDKWVSATTRFVEVHLAEAMDDLYYRKMAYARILKGRLEQAEGQLERARAVRDRLKEHTPMKQYYLSRF